jgi:hypothetical protein
VTQDFGQAARYHASVIALRAPTPLTLGIAIITLMWFAREAFEVRHTRCGRPRAAVVNNPAPPASPEQLTMRWQHEERECSITSITSIVIRGQFTSHEPTDGFTLSFAGSEGHYTTMTDKRGYFEARIPREDFAGDPCELPRHHRHFTDPQLTLTYTIDVER